MITEAKLKAINGLVAKFYHPRTPQRERLDIMTKLASEYGVILESNLANTSS